MSSAREVSAIEVQVKLFLCTSKKANREMEVKYRLFLTLVLDRSERWTSHPDRLTSGERRLIGSQYWSGYWKKGEISYKCGETKYVSPVNQSVG
jgi:hypothetical protein